MQCEEVELLVRGLQVSAGVSEEGHLSWGVTRRTSGNSPVTITVFEYNLCGNIKFTSLYPKDCWEQLTSFLTNSLNKTSCLNTESMGLLFGYRLLDHLTEAIQILTLQYDLEVFEEITGSPNTTFHPSWGRTSIHSAPSVRT